MVNKEDLKKLQIQNSMKVENEQKDTEQTYAHPKVFFVTLVMASSQLRMNISHCIFSDRHAINPVYVHTLALVRRTSFRPIATVPA